MFIFFKKYRERLKLLEYENKILRYEINEIKKQCPKPIMPIPPFARLRNEYGWDLSYEVLKEKYGK